MGALLALETTELLLRLTTVYAPSRVRWLAVAYPYVPLCVAMLLPGLLGSRAGRSGRILLMCGLGLVAVLMLRFRGLWTWDGSFDRYWLSPHPWMISLIVGTASGFLLGLTVRPRRAPSSTLLGGLILATTLLASLNWILARVWSGLIDSYFPPNRLFAIGGVLLALGVLWYTHNDHAPDPVA